MSHIAIKIHWYGPFSLDNIESSNKGNGLYMFTGKRKHQRSDSEIQYFGITEKKYKSRFRQHHKLEEINRDLGIWIGEISYPNEYDRDYLEIAESILVYFWQPELNQRKKYTPPNPTTIISHWFDTNDKPRKKQLSIYKYLPDVISWDGEYWRTGNLKVFEDSF